MRCHLRGSAVAHAMVTLGSLVRMIGIDPIAWGTGFLRQSADRSCRTKNLVVAAAVHTKQDIERR